MDKLFIEDEKNAMQIIESLRFEAKNPKDKTVNNQHKKKSVKDETIKS
jgi:hypothetical protein